MAADPLSAYTQFGIPVISFVAAGAGAYLGSYLKKKGENLATKEDFDDLKAQTAALTTTTKEIEAKIGDEVWNRQKRWELKQAVVFEAAKHLKAFTDAFLEMDRTLKRKEKGQEHLDWDLLINEVQRRRSESHSAFSESLGFIKLVCSSETFNAMNSFDGLTLKMMLDGSLGKQRTFAVTAYLAYQRVTKAFRNELGFEPLFSEEIATSQSSESSTAPDPDMK
jgi:hypothetical protein